MITIEDKIESFKRILNEEIDEKYDEELKKIASETERLITEYKAKKYEEIEKLKREYRTKLENKTDKIRSKTLKEGQDIILNTNKEIYDEFRKILQDNNCYFVKGKELEQLSEFCFPKEKGCTLNGTIAVSYTHLHP